MKLDIDEQNILENFLISDEYKVLMKQLRIYRTKYIEDVLKTDPREAQLPLLKARFDGVNDLLLAVERDREVLLNKNTN